MLSFIDFGLVFFISFRKLSLCLQRFCLLLIRLILFHRILDALVCFFFPNSTHRPLYFSLETLSVLCSSSWILHFVESSVLLSLLNKIFICDRFFFLFLAIPCDLFFVVLIPLPKFSNLFIHIFYLFSYIL